MDRDHSPREMVKGNWTCGTCGGAISELPFEPNPERLASLKCRECHSKSRDEKGGGRGGERRGNSFGRNDGPRQMFQGNWKCGSCGAGINELPFQPDPARVGSLKCRDCHRNSQ
jgi:formate-dependent nitrite reductase cytochrome c552 subunit